MHAQLVRPHDELIKSSCGLTSAFVMQGGHLVSQHLEIAQLATDVLYDGKEHRVFTERAVRSTTAHPGL